MSIQIDIKVQCATVVLSTNDGNVRACGGTDVVWETSDPKRVFNLEFFNLSPDADDSPFVSGEIAATVARGKPFRAKLKARHDASGLNAYKYSVASGALVLDPIIIVDD